MNTGSKNVNRIEFIDIARAIAMVFVVIGHINFANSCIKAWVYAFHMSAFFLISGTVAKWRDDYTGKRLISDTYKSFVSLIIPYILWALVYCDFSLANLARIAYGSYDALSHAGTLTSLWFLPVMFIALLLFRICNLLFRKLNKEAFHTMLIIVLSIISLIVGFIIPNTSFGYPFSINIAFTAFGFLLIGHLFSTTLNRANAKLKDYSGSKMAVSSVLISLVVIVGSFLITLLYRYNIPDHGYVLMGNGIYGNPFLFMIVALFGSVMIFSLAWLICAMRIEMFENMMVFIGMNTLAIFFVQKPIIAVFSKLFSRIHIHSCLALSVTCVGTMAVCCFVAHMINKMAPNLVGRNHIN